MRHIRFLSLDIQRISLSHGSIVTVRSLGSADWLQVQTIGKGWIKQFIVNNIIPNNLRYLFSPYWYLACFGVLQSSEWVKEYLESLTLPWLQDQRKLLINLFWSYSSAKMSLASIKRYWLEKKHQLTVKMSSERFKEYLEPLSLPWLLHIQLGYDLAASEGYTKWGGS